VKVLAKPSFKRDISKLKDVHLLQALSEKLTQIEKASAKENVTGLKVLTGYSVYYRIYVKTEKLSYRIGAVIHGNTMWLVRFLPRRKIYRRFP
jgi:mRNA interferase RelE/StbE